MTLTEKKFLFNGAQIIRLMLVQGELRAGIPEETERDKQKAVQSQRRSGETEVATDTRHRGLRGVQNGHLHDGVQVSGRLLASHLTQGQFTAKVQAYSNTIENSSGTMPTGKHANSHGHFTISCWHAYCTPFCSSKEQKLIATVLTHPSVSQLSARPPPSAFRGKRVLCLWRDPRVGLKSENPCGQAIVDEWRRSRIMAC